MQDHDQLLEALERIARDENSITHIGATRETGDRETLYSVFVRGSEVSHALLLPLPHDSTPETDDFAPLGFHDGAHRDFSPPGDVESDAAPEGSAP